MGNIGATISDLNLSQIACSRQLREFQIIAEAVLVPSSMRSKTLSTTSWLDLLNNGMSLTLKKGISSSGSSS
ncbi:hypothetical protein D5086_012098 [Populus alba]|uniref:Uncharacterized protein n=1 Tax=Populus alba TaxID=43335 RepID=A0ACC4C1Z3_POPAL